MVILSCCFLLYPAVWLGIGQESHLTLPVIGPICQNHKVWQTRQDDWQSYLAPLLWLRWSCRLMFVQYKNYTHFHLIAFSLLYVLYGQINSTVINTSMVKMYFVSIHFKVCIVIKYLCKMMCCFICITQINNLGSFLDSFYFVAIFFYIYFMISACCS